jgi:hypothetical protein
MGETLLIPQFHPRKIKHTILHGAFDPLPFA